MLPLSALIGDIQRAVSQATRAGTGRRGLLQRPACLLSLVTAGEQERAANQARLGVPVPRFCIFSVTWACNLKCVGCYAQRYARGHELALPQIAKVLDEARALGMYLYVIVGGEPLLVPGLIEQLAQRSTSLFFLFTNGTLLNAEHVRQLADADNIVPVLSVEGLPTVTDARRGAGVGGKVRHAMELLRQADVPFGCATMVTHRNLDGVLSREWFDALWEQGARFYYVLDYVPFPADLDEALRLTPADLAHKKTVLDERYAEARPLVMNFPPDEYNMGSCLAAGEGFIHINADGFVEPCPFSHYAADNVQSKSLAEILGSPFFCAVRKHTAASGPSAGGCLLFETDAEVRAIAGRTGAFCTEAASQPSPPSRGTTGG